LLSAEGGGTNAIMRETGKSKTCVWHWQERFCAEGVGGLLRDKTRPSRIPKLAPTVAERVVELTLEPPPDETTHWTSAAMAKAVGVSVSSVQRIWRAHGLQPHRVRQFKLSKDPEFLGKLRDIVGLCVDLPAHAVVLSVDEKSQIQALDRTQPGLPLKKDRAGTMTHDYKRNGTTTLFAAMKVLDGTVVGQNMQRHRHQEFIRFLNAVERGVPVGKVVMSFSTIAQPTNIPPSAIGWRAILAGSSISRRNPPGLNAVEGFFAILTKRRLKRGVFRSVVDLQAAINGFLDDHKAHAKPFRWVADPDKIIAAVTRGHQALDSIH
jgi:transposase